MGRAVAALVKPGAGGVNTQGHPVLHDGKLHLIKLSALGKPLNAVDFLEPFNDSLFYNLLAVGHGEELGVEAVTLYGKGSVRGNDTLPGQGLCALKKLLKASGLKAAKLYKYSLAAAQVYIGAGNLPCASLEIYSAVFGTDIRNIQPFEFIRNGTFEPKKAGNA